MVRNRNFQAVSPLIFGMKEILREKLLEIGIFRQFSLQEFLKV